MVLLAHLPTEILDLALLLGVAGVVTIIFKLLKQPVVLGYIVAGMLVGSYSNFFPTIMEGDNIKLWGEIGVIFLLFAMGLEFSFKKLINNGKTGFITLVVILMGLGTSGFALGMFMGWGHWNSFFLGAMLCLSSTTIIVKAFDDPRYRGKKFTEVVFGILIFDDLFAILLMVFMGTLSVSKNVEGAEILMSLGKMLFFMIIWVVCGIFLIPSLLKKLKSILNDETLLVVSLGLCLIMVVFATYVGLSAELGAFIMGSILAETIFLERIEHVTKPIKDFFGAIFFVSVGMLLDPMIIVVHWQSILLITILVIIGKIVFTTIGARLSGERMEVSFQSGLSMAQVGEFSFIVAGTAIAYNLADDFIYPIIIAVSIITTFTTPYFMAAQGKIYNLFMNTIPVKWKNRIIEDDSKLSAPTEPTAWSAFLKNYIFNILVFGSLCIAIIALSLSFLGPLLKEYIPSPWAEIVQLLITLIVMAPLLKGLVYRGGEQPYLILKLWQESVGNRLILSAFIVIRYIIAFALVYFLFWRLLNFSFWILGVVAVVLLLLIFKSKSLMKLYWKMEYQFVLNFNQRMIHEKKKSSKEKGTIETLDLDNENWMEKNLYVARFKINSGSNYVHKRLKETNFRQRYDLLIVSVCRSDKEQMLPNGDFELEDGDFITVAGSIIQIDLLKSQNNSIVFQADRFKTFHEYSKYLDRLPDSKVQCISLIVDKSSGLYQKSILESEMGRKGACYVVGIERKQSYLINPPANTTFEGGDIVWLIGSKETIHHLVNQNFSFNQI